MPSSYENEVLHRKYFGVQGSVAVGTPAVLDLRGAAGFTVYLNGGTATQQACDEDGTVVPGSASAAAANGGFVAADWPFVKITAATAACIAAVVHRA
jgi:hypothetical protein